MYGVDPPDTVKVISPSASPLQRSVSPVAEAVKEVDSPACTSADSFAHEVTSVAEVAEEFSEMFLATLAIDLV